MSDQDTEALRREAALGGDLALQRLRRARCKAGHCLCGPPPAVVKMGPLALEDSITIGKEGVIMAKVSVAATFESVDDAVKWSGWAGRILNE